MVLLELQNCTICYRTGIPAIADVSFSVAAGEIVSIVGESGSGKTTLIRAILGLLPPGGRITAGSILFCGQDLSKASPQQQQALRGRDISMIFQDVGAALDPIARIGTQYKESIAVHERLKKQDYRARALEMLRRVQLTDGKRILNAYPFELSGGMKQRVGIAMGMTSAPKLLLADEPTSALDVTIQAQVVRQLRQLRDTYGTTIILVTHNMGVASYLSDKIGVMQNSRLVEFGAREQVVFRPQQPYTRALLDAVPKLGGKRFAK